ncbi:MAG: hypothetical protein IJU94_03385 [Clostridia bacterium]|nr:hypothetical protein [Clostridia bacterium]
MKKTLSMLLAVMFALTAFGVTTVFGGVLGAGAVFYDYFEYVSIPGFTAFTEAEMQKAWTTSCNFSGFSSDYKPDGVDKVATFTCTSPDKYSGMVAATMELKNSELSSWGGPLDSCIWGANNTLGGKDFLGNTSDADGKIIFETSFEMNDVLASGFCFWTGVNGGHYDGSVKIQLFTVPCKGPAYATSNDGSTDMAKYDTGFVYECDGVRPDEDGYVYFDFKTDFFQCDWWSTDDDGINWYRGADPNDPDKYPHDKYHFPISKCAIPQSKIPKINGIQLRFSSVQAGDVVSIGDWRMYFDTRIHTDELEEQCDIFDALDPEAYTEESYAAATEVYLEAYEMIQNAENYTQKQVDAMTKELKQAIAALKPMFKAEMKSVKLAGFEVWDDVDLEAMSDGGLCLDTAMVDDSIYPSTKDQSVMIFAQAVDGPPTYGWSLFTNATEDGAVKNPFELQEGSEPLSAASGIRFWMKWDDSLEPAPQACRIGLGVSAEEIYFECEETAVELPEKQGYVGVSWVNFYDVDGDEDIYDWIDQIDTIYIYLEDVTGIYYIADLTGFEWSISSADFYAFEARINEVEEYMAGINRADYYYISLDRVDVALEEAKDLLGKYGVTQEDADEALDKLNTAVNNLTLIGDLADEATIKLLEGLTKSAKTYWRGNVTSITYVVLAEEIETADALIQKGPKQDEAEGQIAALRAAISGLVPIKPTSTVTSIHSFENYTNRELTRANGDRTDGVTYELDGTFAKLPAGYNQALKMTAQVDMGSETTDEHGMMQFKAMTRDNGGVDPILIDNSTNPPGNTLIGDLTGTAGLCLWVGVNDMNLVQKCTMRVAVSNCSSGPYFENATVDIPIPANGCGWIYLPWEYFEYFDEWTHGQETDLAKIYFYIMRFDGFIKAGLEVYITGIHAYKDPVAGTWTAPVIKNITEGQSIDVSEQDFIPDWDVGAAMLDGEFLIYGNPVVKNGAHTLVVTNGDKSTTVNFSTTGAIELSANVEENGEYDAGYELTWEPADADAYLNDDPIEVGYKVNEPGEYTLIITKGDKELTVNFTILDKPAYKMGDMDKDGEITVGDALMTLRIAAKLVVATDEQRIIGDVDKDGDITVGDALKILRVAAKLVPESDLG